MAKLLSHIPITSPKMAEAIRVFVMDNHDVFAQSLQEYLNDEPDIHVVGTAAATALAIAAAARPQVVVIAPDPDDGTMGDAIRELRSALPSAGIIVLTLHQAEAQNLIGLEAGADALLEEWSETSDLASAIRAVVPPTTIQT